jgi:hypothetical protein
MLNKITKVFCLQVGSFIKDLICENESRARLGYIKFIYFFILHHRRLYYCICILAASEAETRAALVKV